MLIIAWNFVVLTDVNKQQKNHNARSQYSSRVHYRQRLIECYFLLQDETLCVDLYVLIRELTTELPDSYQSHQQVKERKQLNQTVYRIEIDG